MKNSVLALGTIVGTTVGAGIFAIPYAVAQSGIIAGLFYFFLLGGAVLLLHLLFGEIILRTEGSHRLIGYAQIYLGKKGKFFITISTIVGLTGTLLAYIVLGGTFLETIFDFLPAPQGSILFALALSPFIFRGIRLIAPAEVVMNVVFVAIILFVFALALPRIQLDNFVFFQPGYMFLPYGVLLFAFAGWLAVPEVVSLLTGAGERKQLFGIIVSAAAIVAVLYALFAFAVVGVSGISTSKDALSGLVPHLGRSVIVLGAIFGLTAVAASFLVLGNYLKNALRYDYNTPVFWAALFPVGLPLILFLLGFREFIVTIGLVGVLIGIIEGIAIILIFQKAKRSGARRPEYSIKVPRLLLYALMAIFIIGAFFEIAGVL